MPAAPPPQIPIIRGDTYYWYIALTDVENGGDFDLSGCVIRIVAKPAVTNDATDVDQIFTHRIALDGSGGIISTDGFTVGGKRPDGTVATLASEGVLTEKLTAAESTAFLPGQYVYDVQVTLPNGDVHTPINARPLEPVVGDVARETA